MSKKNDGGPAFPLAWQEHLGDDYAVPHHEPGLSVRDYFAGKVLAEVTRVVGITKPDQIATWVYEIADAMLKAREE